MATSSGDFAPGAAGSRTIDDLLICPVCLEPFKEPKTLSCLHTFCTICLENCRRPYRRDISCPVCKKVTPLSPAGVQGLQNDFRIQQIREIINRQSSSPPPNASSGPRSPEPHSADGENHVCDICKSRQRRTSASVHCSQCSLFFCTQCLEKHDQNALFSGHHIVDLETDSSTDKLFCKTHKDCTVKFFCKPCGSMLCTICIMDHPPDHSPVPLDRSTIEKYQKDLHESLRVINSKLSEVKSRTKYLETVKQTHQKVLFETQATIRERTNELIAQIKEQEKNLLKEVQQRMEARMREIGLDMLGEMNFHKMNIENLYSDVQTVIKGSPQECLLVYEDLIGRMKAVSETTLPSLQKSKATNIVKFIPSDEVQMGVALGQLQECTLDEADAEEPSSPTSPLPSSSYATLLSMAASPTKAVPRRVTSILNALSSSRKSEVKIGKVKAFSTAAASPPRAKSPNAINADELMSGITTSGDDDSSQPQPSTSGLVSSNNIGPLSPSSPPPSSPSQDDPPPSSGFLTRPKVVFKIDQIGGWPGKIMSPSAVAFLPDGSVIVCECENRLQIFDRKGNSMKIIAWGKIKPQGVVVTRDGKIAITDKKDKCIKIYSSDGDCKAVWGQGMFSLPTGITCTHSGKFVITDVDRHMVSVHSPDGAMLTQFGCWGSGDYQFNSPTYVTVNQEEQIIVSDSCNGCVKIFDKAGKFIKKFTVGSSGAAQGQVKRPQGLCVDPEGKIIVADRDNNRVSMYSSDGHFIKHILERKDSIRYPCDVCINNEGQVAVVESHSGFLSKEPHHAVKMFQIKQGSS